MISTASTCNINYCQECSNNICTKCERYKYLDSNNMCCTTSNCHDCSHSNICSVCQDGFILKNSFCCPENCLSCTLDSYCLSCYEGYTPKGGICIECPENCSSCDIDNFCYACKEDYKISLGRSCKAIEKYSNKTYIIYWCVVYGGLILSSLLLYNAHKCFRCIIKSTRNETMDQNPVPQINPCDNISYGAVHAITSSYLEVQDLNENAHEASNNDNNLVEEESKNMSNSNISDKSINLMNEPKNNNFGSRSTKLCWANNEIGGNEQSQDLRASSKY
ncbi:hypothetical protein SteCoe_34249 [Stentor coeruleus]|uniref:TNFR-Cys domain-containing protein n=1 Tax=Stentor coeruleus TaxID=5963 RepID=A0A1R2AVB2_9CILI|nr:hypothetical protein SteCoe_34249 [Stentor coeruleus]